MGVGVIAENGFQNDTVNALTAVGGLMTLKD